MPSPKLRVTRRCLTDDLALDGDLVKTDARVFRDTHAAVKKFVDMRSVAVDTAEPIYGNYKRGLICSLHVGGARGVTTYDSSTDVCWLLGFNEYHRNGDPNDAYNIFNAQYDAGALMPTEDDWDAALADDHDDFLEDLRETGTKLLAQARAEPGREAVETYHDGGTQVICVDLLVESDGQAEEGWLGLTLPENEALSDGDVYDFVASLLPPGVDPEYRTEFKNRPRRRGEIVFTWEQYESPGPVNDPAD